MEILFVALAGAASWSDVVGSGGEMAGPFQRPSTADLVETVCLPDFLNSSVALVLLSRRLLKSVMVVLDGKRRQGFSSVRWPALHTRWSDAFWQGPVGLSLSSFSGMPDP